MATVMIRLFILKRSVGLFAIACATAGVAFSADAGGSVYPAAVGTVLPGIFPGPGGTSLGGFVNYFGENTFAGGHGESLVPGFRLNGGTAAGAVFHNWGIHVLGGMLVSGAGIPYYDMHLNAPYGKSYKTGFGNPDLRPAAISYVKRDLFFWYGMDVYTPAPGYDKTALLNIGQHNWAVAPAAAFTWLPDRGRTELSSKFQYVVNYANAATNYRSGNEAIWEFDGMRHIGKMVSFGASGYYYQQTTADTLNGVQYLDGNRARDVELGPQVRCNFKHYILALKYEKDLFAENHVAGKSIWFQLGVPLPNHRTE